MSTLAKELADAVQTWDQRGWPRPRVVAVAGSGLEIDLGPPSHGPFPLTELLPFAAAGIEGHSLTFELVRPSPERPVLYLRGRLHAYQGFSPAEVVFPLRLGALLGARVLFVSNASGGLHRHQRPGEVRVLSDHLNLTGQNPLVGALPPEWGPRFPDLQDAYDPTLRRLAQELAREHGFELEEAVYAGLLGPSYETPAEIRMLDRLGADLVGMSTVLEVIAARHMGMRCLGLSVVTNPAAGISDDALDHQDVLATGQDAAPRVEALWRSLLAHPELA